MQTAITDDVAVTSQFHHKMASSNAAIADPAPYIRRPSMQGHLQRVRACARACNDSVNVALLCLIITERVVVYVTVSTERPLRLQYTNERLSIIICRVMRLLFLTIL